MSDETDDKHSRADYGELDLHGVSPGGYMPWDCSNCGRRRLELLLRPVRFHCEKCRAVVLLNLRNLPETDFWEKGELPRLSTVPVKSEVLERLIAAARALEQGEYVSFGAATKRLRHNLNALVAELEGK